MSGYTDTTHELGWDDEIQQDGGPFQVLPEGDYRFTVKKFERARHSGSERMPTCNKAILTLAVAGPGASGEVLTNLFLHSKVEWKLCQFFTAIGQRKHGEAVRMNWGAVPGASGVCRVGVRRWTGSDGKERESNEIAEFYAPDAAPAVPAESACGDAEQTWVSLPREEPTPWASGKF